MKASELPPVEGATHFLVRGPYSWGRSDTLEKAIAAAQVRHNTIVHVCWVDPKACCDEVDGSLRWNIRGDIWEGRVWSKDITLKKVTHPVRKKE